MKVSKHLGLMGSEVEQHLVHWAKRPAAIPLAVVVITNDLYRRAQGCLVEAHRRLSGSIRSVQEDPLTRAVVAMLPHLEPQMAAILEDLCNMDSGALEALFLKGEGEMMAVLDELEPV